MPGTTAIGRDDSHFLADLSDQIITKNVVIHSGLLMRYLAGVKTIHFEFAAAN